MQKYFYRILFLSAVLLLVSCSSSVAEESALQGSILVWHDWSGVEAEVLNELFDKFTEIYPNVRIIRPAIPLDENNLHDKFITHTEAGLGPDLLIFRASSIPEFADRALIQDITHREEIDRPNDFISSYVSSEVKELKYNGKLYGLPFSLSTHVLYYNKNMVNNPPATLPDLLEQAYAGQRVALDSSFEGAFWGVKAFGGQLFDDEGRVAIGQGGFTNWLGWLKNAQSVPNIILGHNKNTLYDLFVKRQVAYYVGTSRELPQLEKALGENVVKVAPLPSGPIEKAGPLLQVEALMFSKASNPAETELAWRLAKFLTNVEQQTTLAMKEMGRLPTNSRITIDERVSPIASAFAKQSKTGVTIALSNMSKMDEVIPIGNELYAQVLAGVEDRNEAVNRLAQQVNDQFGVNPFSCVPGRIRVWHSWDEADAAVLDEIRRDFMDLCPQSIIDLIAVDKDSTSIYVQYREQVAQDKGPDLLIDSTNLELFSLMVANDLLRDISELVEQDLLQRFVPRAQEAMRYKNKLYGLPLSMELMALYYKKDLDREVPSTLDDLLNQADPKQQVVLPLGFEQTYWGVSAFGGQLLNEKNRLILNQGGFIEWLMWLQQARNQSGIVFSNDPDELPALFAERNTAYLAGGHKLLTQLQEQLGPERIGVAPLPAGPRGPAGPILTVEGIMLNPASNEQQAALAFHFAKYLTSAESQQTLLAQTNRVPANVNVNISANYPAIAGFIEQAKTATVPPNVREMEAVWKEGADLSYEELLTNESNLAEVVYSFVDKVNDYNRFVLNAEKPTLACEGEGEVLLWHSWHPDEPKAGILEGLTKEFSDSCSKIQVKTLFVPADQIPTQLITEGVELPDFFLVPHDLIVPLANDGLIKSIPPLGDRGYLGQLYPWSITPLKHNDALYGLPLTSDLMALYYHTDWVDSAPDRLDKLLATAADAPVALDSSFYGAFWGVSAFGGQIFDNKGDLALNPPGFVEWLTWLQSAKNQPSMVLLNDQEALQARFASGEVAYLVAGPDALTSLSLGLEQFDVTSLPAGPAGHAKPFLRVEGFIFTATAPEEATLLAHQFAEFATSVYSQKQLMDEANLVPTNSKVEVDLNSPIAHFINEAREGLPLPPRSDTSIVFEAGNTVYQNVLENGQNPVEAVNSFVNTLNQVAGE